MTASMAAVLLLAFGFSAEAARNAAFLNDAVSPELHPKSDKKFFGKDYPDDLRPSVKDHFNYPFPIVQESTDYDKDYIKDENKDNGEWKAQSEYDHLRTKLSNLKSDVAGAEKAEQDREDAAKAAEEKLKAAEDAAKAAKEAADAAEKQAEEAKEVMEAHPNHTEDNGTENGTEEDAKVGNASAEVDKDEMDLEECMKQLADTQDQLKKLLEEKVKRHTEHQAALEAAANASALEAGDAKSAAELAKLREEAEQKHADSEKSYEEEKKKLEDMKKELEEKAKVLRGFRETAMGKAGALYTGDHSDAKGAVIVGPLLLALALLSRF